MKNLFAILFFSCTLSAFAQSNSAAAKETEVAHKWRVSLPYFIITDRIGANFGNWNSPTSTQMIELHLKRKFALVIIYL